MCIQSPHLFLCHCPFKGLRKYVKKWLLTPRGYEWLPRVAYPGRLTQRSIIPWGDWLAGVCDPGKLDFMISCKIWSHDSLGFDNPASLTPRGMILRWVNLPGVSYCTESISWVCDPGNSCFGGFFNCLARVWYPGESCIYTAFSGKNW